MINAPVDINTDYLGGLGDVLFIGGLLDHFVPQGLINAYSCSRKLVTTAGLAYRARRLSDNAEQEIGFIGNDINITALTSFSGVNSTGVVRLYDQVQFNHLIEQGVDGEWITVSSGSLLTRDSHPIMRRPALLAPTSAYVPVSFGTYNDFTIFFVASFPSSFIASISSADFTTSDVRMETGTAQATLSSVVNTQAVAALTINSIHLYVCRYDNSNDTITYFVNGNNVGTDTQASATLTFQRVIRAGAEADFLELLFFDNSLSDTVITSVSENIIAHYGI